MKKNPNTSEKGFKKLLARCMAKALFTHAKKRKSGDLENMKMDSTAYRNTVKRLEHDILKDADFTD
ncbi:MAG: hypothetical protein ACPGJS_01170 [Flammeovirgaceae bacterium]